MAFIAFELLEDGLPLVDTGTARRLPDSDGFGGGALERIRGEALEVLDDTGDLAGAEPRFPFGHRRAGHADLDHVTEIVVGRDLAACRRTNLINSLREVARVREHRLRSESVAGAGIAVATGAPFVVDDLAVLRAQRGGNQYCQHQQRQHGRTRTEHGRTRTLHVIPSVARDLRVTPSCE